MQVSGLLFVKLTVLLAVGHIRCGELKEVELIPEELRNVELLGSNLEYKLNNDKRLRRNYRFRDDDIIEFDQQPSGSDLLSPGIDIENSEFTKGQLGREKLAEYQAGGQHESGNAKGEIGFYGNTGQKGESGHVSEDSYVGSRAAAHKDRADTGYYGDVEGINKGHNVGQVYGLSRELGRKGVLGAAVGSKGGHRKGHHSSGFHKSYHKDESANNTNFYDDAVDSGEHFLLDAKDNYYNDHATDVQKGNYHDGAYQDKILKKQGNYGEANGYDAEQVQKGNYGRDKYYNDNLKYGHKQLGENYGKVRHSALEDGGERLYQQNSGVQGNRYKYPDYVAVGKHNFDNKGRDYYPVGDYSDYSATALSALPYKKVGQTSGVSGADSKYNTPEHDSIYGVYRGVAY